MIAHKKHIFQPKQEHLSHIIQPKEHPSAHITKDFTLPLYDYDIAPAAQLASLGGYSDYDYLTDESRDWA